MNSQISVLDRLFECSDDDEVGNEKNTGYDNEEIPIGRVQATRMSE